MSGLFTGLGSIIQFQHLVDFPLSLNLNTMTLPLVAIVFGGTLLTGGSGGPIDCAWHFSLCCALSRFVYFLISPETLQLIVGLLLFYPLYRLKRIKRGLQRKAKRGCDGTDTIEMVPRKCKYGNFGDCCHCDYWHFSNY